MKHEHALRGMVFRCLRCGTPGLDGPTKAPHLGW